MLGTSSGIRLSDSRPSFVAFTSFESPCVSIFTSTVLSSHCLPQPSLSSPGQTSLACSCFIVLLISTALLKICSGSSMLLSFLWQSFNNRLLSSLARYFGCPSIEGRFTSVDFVILDSEQADLTT